MPGLVPPSLPFPPLPPLGARTLAPACPWPEGMQHETGEEGKAAGLAVDACTARGWVGGGWQEAGQGTSPWHSRLEAYKPLLTNGEKGGEEVVVAVGRLQGQEQNYPSLPSFLQP